MNFHIFKRKLHEQVDRFIDYKIEKGGVMSGVSHKEWLAKFLVVIRKECVKDLVTDDVYIFKGWLLDHYASDYLISDAIHTIRCFLKFYRRYDILCEMAKVGRKPNLKQIEYVKHYRKKGLSFRDIQALLGRAGRIYDLKTLHFWAHYKKPAKV